MEPGAWSPLLMPKKGKSLERYLRMSQMPTLWCPGCGHGNIARGMLQAFDELHLNLDQTVVIGGIGCSGRTPFYSNTNAMHTTHGRALAFGTGIKMANPDLTVVATMGDGDTAAIGGNHFIHSCRRNIDITAIVFNNSIYGMTGGQFAPTTPQDKKSSTTVYGNIDEPFDIAELAMAAGASFVARTTTFDFQDTTELIKKGIQHHGFSVVEIITQCPTYYGKINKLGNAVDMLEYEKDMTFPEEDEPIDWKELSGQMPLGIFREEQRSEYTDRYRELRESQKSKTDVT